MTTIKKIKIAMAVMLVAAIALFLFHNLPRTAVVQISGTDVKRVDRESGEQECPGYIRARRRQHV